MGEKIENRMKDCGGGRHVGWWSEDDGFDESSLLIEVRPNTVLIACRTDIPGERAVNFITDHAKAVEIVRALAKALGMQLAPEPAENS